MPSPMYPWSPICEGGLTPDGRSVVGTSSSPERRRASVPWPRPSWGSERREVKADRNVARLSLLLPPWEMHLAADR